MIGILLKEQTKTLHDLVEDKLMSHKIMDRSFNLEEYQQLIRYNYQFIAEYENAVFSELSDDINQRLQSEDRMKLPFLTKDLSHFATVPPKVNNKISIKNDAEALGILYVMEGPTLGGNVILKSLSKNPVFEGMAIHYFGCYGDQTGARWKRFKEVLEEESHKFPKEDFVLGAKTAYQFLLNL